MGSLITRMIALLTLGGFASASYKLYGTLDTTTSLQVYSALFVASLYVTGTIITGRVA